LAPSLYIGVISGTSVDGLDIALLQTQPALAIVDGHTRPFDPALRELLLALGQPGPQDLDDLGLADAAFAEAVVTAVRELLASKALAAEDIAAIGCHGQTVRHRPPSAPARRGRLEFPFTMQIGDPNRVVEGTGITTVADFRRRDLAAGGEGAPLAPLFHEALFGRGERERAVLNLGGIGNLSWLPADRRPVRGFDCGPGNALMDHWVARHRQEPQDEGGAWAASGRVLVPLLEQMLADAFVTAAPPKSTGREHFSGDWLDRQLAAYGAAAPADVQATLAEFTARCAIDALQKHHPAVTELIVVGGGRHNAHLLRRLAAQAGNRCRVLTSEALGVDGDSLEAALFAWLAFRTLAGLAVPTATITGARGDRVLGGVYRP